MEIIGNLRHLGLIRIHHYFIDPMGSFEEIMRHILNWILRIVKEIILTRRDLRM